MFSMLDPRLWLAVALAIALSFGGGYFKGRSDGAKQVRLEWDAAVSLANSQARHLEQERQRRADDAARIAAAREVRIRADAARARSELDGLRVDLSAIERASKESHDAATQAVAALADVFEQCSRRYSEMAEIADRHAADSLMYQQSWPK